MRIVQIFLCFLLGYPFFIFAQDKTDYRFVVRNDTLADSSNSYEFGKEFEFKYQRLFFKNNIFRERGLFSEDTLNTVELFKVVSGKWYFKYNQMWHLFFNGGNEVKSIFYVNGISYRLIWQHSSNKKVYDLTLKPIGVSVSHVPRYIFSPQNGIIVISGEVTLIREDFRNKVF